MGWDKVQTIALGLFLTGVLSFSVWAATSINSLTTSATIAQREADSLHKTIDLQQAQIATFNRVLGEINADVKVMRAIMEERDKRGGQ